MLYSAAQLPSSLRSILEGPPRLVEEVGPISQHDLLAHHQASDVGARFFDHVDLGEALQLYQVVRELQPEHTLEIGFCTGASGLAILQALKDTGRGIHHVCDPFQSTYAKGRGLENVRLAGLSNFLDFHEAFPEVVVPSLPSLQFCFIDASHLFDLSILDFVLADKRLQIGGILAFHDLWMPSLQAVLRYVLKNRNYRLHRPLGSEAPPPARAQISLLKRTLASVLRRIPHADRYFTSSLLQPWRTLGVGNLVFLEKTGEDDRDWKTHVPF